MQAIATKELRSRMRGGRAFAVLTIYMLLLSCLVIAVYAFIQNIVEPQNRQFGGPPPPLGRILFYAVTAVELLLIAPLAPAFSANAIAGERERQTFDLVMTTPVSARSFVLGKLVSSLSYILLLLFVSLPVQVLALLFGGLSRSEVFVGFWILIVAAIFYASVSLFFSAVMQTTTSASVFSYLAVALTLIGAVFVLLMLGVLGSGIFGLFSEFDRGPATWAIYLGLFLISLTPLTAGGASAAALVANEGAFWFRFREDGSLPGHPTGLLIVSPWVIYTAVYLAASALLIWLAIRRVRPTHARHASRPARPLDAAPPAAPPAMPPPPPPPAPRAGGSSG